MTQAEKNAIAAILGTCPGEPLPGGAIAQGSRRLPAPTPAPAPAPGTGSQARARSRAGTRASSYANCTAARAAGCRPLHRGDPGYSRSSTGTATGSACE